MTAEEKDAIRSAAEKCRARGCRCITECHRIWNRYWTEKAEACTSPNFFLKDEGNADDR